MEVLKLLIPLAIEGTETLFLVFFVTLLLSLPLGILVAKLRLSKNKLVSKLAEMYIDLMRGTPLLLQLMFIFFGLPMIPKFGIAIDRFPAIYLAFVLNYGAYFAEIFRAGIQSIPVGQEEAAEVLGLSKFYAFRKIILPQVMKNIMPAISNEVTTLVKDTSLVYILGVTDLLKAAKSASNTFSAFSPYVFVAIEYLVIIAILTKLLNKVEKKFDYFK